MKCKHFFALTNVIFWIVKCHARNLISANDSVNVQNCDLADVKNISQLHPRPGEVIIKNCLIDELPNALFIRFHTLRSLEITESQLRAISDFAFNGLSGLELLNLSRNNLTTVQTWSNENLNALQMLDLRRNAIAGIHKFAFKRYPNLLKLNLAVNHISEIPDELFRWLPLLKYLNLGKNNLESIDSHTFKHLHKLIHLELKHNQIQFIEADSFVGSTHMKVLHLQENFITSLHHELVSNLPRLQQLNISHNLLGNLSNDSFVKNEELLSLDISFNKLKEFTELTFKGLEVLEFLNASHNTLQYIDNTIFTDLANLHYLDLSNNLITHLFDGTFEMMSHLKSMKLNGNMLKSIDDKVFVDLNLAFLDLSCNSLYQDNFLWDNIGIEYLNLTFNEYRDINVTALKNIAADLWGNPFSCDWLLRKILRSKNIRLGRDYVVDSVSDIATVSGIRCFVENLTNERHLIVVQARLEDMTETLSEDLQISRNSFVTQHDSDDFAYQSILLWLSCGCLGVFIALRLLKCLLNSSERKSEAYRLSRRRSFTFSEDLKSSTDFN